MSEELIKLFMKGISNTSLHWTRILSLDIVLNISNISFGANKFVCGR